LNLYLEGIFPIKMVLSLIVFELNFIHPISKTKHYLKIAPYTKADPNILLVRSILSMFHAPGVDVRVEIVFL
jgi:hypothetical protein